LATVIASCFAANQSRAATVAYWRFEEGAENSLSLLANSVLDYSGNGHNGTPINGPTYRSDVAQNPLHQTGATNARSLDFNGVDQRIFIPDSPQFELTHSFTLEAFFKLRPITSPDFAGQIIYRGDDRIALDPYTLTVLPDGNLDLRIESLTNEFHLQAPIGDFNQWHHVAGTLDDNTGDVKLFVDGTLEASTVTSVRPFAALDPNWLPGLGIGDVQSDNYAEHFNGLIDEVRISDVALQPNQFLSVPEPSSLVLLTWGTFALVLRRRTQRLLKG
jgi:hypothetical protein